MLESELTPKEHANTAAETELRVRRIHRRDLNRVWEFLKWFSAM